VLALDHPWIWESLFQRPMTAPLPSPRQAVLGCVFAAVTALVCGSLFTAAALEHAPPVVLPLLVIVCIGCPIISSWNVPVAIAVLRATASDRRERRSQMLGRHSVAELRRVLDGLPETEHPLGG
jgi:hypothetical protein